MSKILVVHGPNLNLLGQRETDIYGQTSLEEINASLEQVAKENDVELEIMQSNHEGEIVDAIGKVISKDIKAILINPAAYTHTSVAIRDAVAAVSVPTVEVHISNVHAREEFRKKSLIAPVCYGQVSGFGSDSYLVGLLAIVQKLKR